MKYSCKLFLFFILIYPMLYSLSYSQVDLVPPSHRIYDFLDRMNINRIIDTYSSSIKPISRREIAGFLNEIKNKKSKLSKTDKKLLDDFTVEFDYDINRSLKKTSSFFSDLKFQDIFSDKKQKYFYANADSSHSIFWDAIGEIRYIGADGDSLGKPHVLLGQLGTRLRGTLFNSVGYYLRLSNGVRLSGNNTTDPQFAAQFDPVLASTRKFVSEGSKTFDSFEGYLRYAPSNDWLGLTVGREALKFGTGFIDKLIVSNNSAPFDFLKLDLSYKKIKYTFFHSSIVGNDTSGSQLESKYFVYHRLEIGPMFSGFMRLGFNEMVIYSNIPINFAFLNPISFLTSADLNTELPGKNSNNTLIAFDAQFFPVKKLSLQTSLLIDDLNFETLGDSGAIGNDNKFAYQAGINWEDAFTLSNLNLVYEFTHIDPFVYSHRDFNNSYAHWNQPLGHYLNPNSDEHAFKLSFNFGSRLNLSLAYKLQRSGMNFIDTAGQLVNVGSNILDGRGDLFKENKFLGGLRVDKKILTAEITWQPIRQYYLSVKFQNRTFNYVDQNRDLSDNVFWGSFRVDY